MIYQFGDCTFDSVRAEVRRSGETIHTTPQVLRVLRYLLEHRDRAVSRDELIEQCWSESYVSDMALTSCLKRLRQAIGQTQTGPTLIATRHRRGYQFVAEVTEFSETTPARPEVRSRAPSPIEPEDAFTQVEEPASSPSALWPEPVAVTERRHLTVLSCTLWEAERLAQQLDPEDAFDLMQIFHTTALAVITQHEGHLVQHVGHRWLVYFGYPQAQEDAAQRAVRSGLALLEALSRVATAELTEAASVAVGVAIDSGMVIVSSGAVQEAPPTLAMGSPLTGAMRLGELAPTGTVVISEATMHLVDGYFDCKTFHLPALADQPESQIAYEVLCESALRTRIEIGMARGLTPFVGREAELALLLDRWTYAQENMGQVVLLRGEAGIGKSRLLQALKEQIVDEQPKPLECRCLPYYQHTALYPLIDLLQRTLKARSAASIDIKTLEALLSPNLLPLQESASLLATLLSLPLPDERYPPLNLSPQCQRERTLDVLSALLIAQASEFPVLFIVEDLHWADPSTLEFLKLLIGQISTVSILVVLTCRPTFEAPWTEPTWMTPMTLNRLTRPQTQQMITQVAGGKRFSAEVIEQLAEKMDGVPLFIEELTRAVLETGQFREAEIGDELVDELTQLSIPSTLHDSLMARLDHLGPAKEIAQWGAVLGREFTYGLIELVAPHDEEVLKAGLDRLVASELVFQRGLGSQTRYRFKHALVQDVAYQSLRRHMRQACHQRVAQVLAEQFAETAETQPELLAHHYTEAGEPEPAVIYWQKAGQHAVDQSAYGEGIAHLTRGIRLIRTLPETSENLQLELEMQIALGPILQATQGMASSEVEQTYKRARELCEQSQASTQLLFHVLRGLYSFYINIGRIQTALEFAEEMHAIAQQQHNTGFPILSHYVLGVSLFYHGEFTRSRYHLEQSIAYYNAHPDHIHTPHEVWRHYATVHSRSCLIWILWFLGYPERALQLINETFAFAMQVGHPFSVVTLATFIARVYQCCGDVKATLKYAQRASDICSEQDFVYYQTCCTLLSGWALGAQGHIDTDITRMTQDLEKMRATRVELNLTYFLTLLTEIHARRRDICEAFHFVDEALRLVKKNEECFYESELLRLQGELLLAQSIDNQTEAEFCFHRALEISRHQQAKSLELRAATSLSRLWQDQGKRDVARELLSDVYGWFTEGHDTADLRNAKALLVALS